jgi:hypothetical protein
VLSEICQFFAATPKETITAVYNEWIAKFECVIEGMKEYYHND